LLGGWYGDSGGGGDDDGGILLVVFINENCWNFFVLLLVLH
jgi:hypothetical protein